MKTLAYIGLVLLASACSSPKEEPDQKALLLEQLKNTHTQEAWFAPLDTAIRGLTAEQANWSDSTDNHSIGQLVAHLSFWNERVLKSFQGNTPPDFKGNNQETFTGFDQHQWQALVHRLDSIQTMMEQVVAGASQQDLSKWSATIANVCSHNAYHTGQMVYIRKRNGWWKKPQ